MFLQTCNFGKNGNCREKRFSRLHDLDCTFCIFLLPLQFRNHAPLLLHPRPQHPETQICGSGLPLAKLGEDSVQVAIPRSVPALIHPTEESNKETKTLIHPTEESNKAAKGLKQTWSTQKFCRPCEPVFHCTMESSFANPVIVIKHAAVLPNTGRTVKKRHFFYGQPAQQESGNLATSGLLDKPASLRTPGTLTGMSSSFLNPSLSL